MKLYSAFINGEWVQSESKETIDSYNPYNQEVWASFPNMTAKDVEYAVGAATKAFVQWKKTNGLERATLLNKLADLMELKADELAIIESTDNGKVIRETKNQVRFAARNYRYFAGYADKLQGDLIPLDNNELLDYTIREPLGVCALITA